MAKKDNFNQAMYDMFGVGKGAEQTDGSAAVDAAQDENVVRFSGNDGPGLKVISSTPTYLAPGTKMEGTLRAEGSVEIDGEFKGDIIAEGSVTIRTDVTGNITAKCLNIVGCCLTGDAHVSEYMVLNEGSSVNGNVNAGDLSSSGAITGDLKIQRNMTLDERAKVVGNVVTGTMTIARGAIIRGSVETRGEDAE